MQDAIDNSHVVTRCGSRRFTGCCGECILFMDRRASLRRNCSLSICHSILASDAIIKIFPPQNDFTLLISAMDLFWSIFSDFTSCAIFLCFYKFIPQINQHAKQILGLYSNNLDVRASTPNLWRVLTVPSHWQYILSYLQGLGDGHQICK